MASASDIDKMIKGEHYHSNTSKGRKSEFGKCLSKDCCIIPAFDENGQELLV